MTPNPPYWGSRGRRFKSGRPDAGQKADSKSGVGLLVHLGTKIDGQGVFWRFLTGSQGVAGSNAVVPTKGTGQRDSELRPRPLFGSSGHDRSRVRSGQRMPGARRGAFELVGQEHEEHGDAGAQWR
jgi:hypothetical protein